MAKTKRSNIQDKKEGDQHAVPAEDKGHLNLAFEPCEPGDIVKSRSKEDISTLNKNLKELEKTPKVNKKKKFNKDGQTERIQNDLFEGEGTKRRSKKKGGSKKQKQRGGIINSTETSERMEMAPIGSQEEVRNNADEDEEEINVVVDKAAKKKTKSKSIRARSRSKDQDSGSKSGSQKSLRSSGDQQGQVEQKQVSRRTPTVEAVAIKKDQVMGVLVHYSDCLKLDFFVLHPVVKVSIVNLSNGRLIAKSDKSRRVTSFYEGEHVSHIVQLMTQPYDFKQKRSIIPRWEELLLFNENPEYLQGFGANLGIFFEIVDFVRMSSVNNETWRHTHGTGWHHVAWGFLKPVPSRIYSNLCKRVRLQLYKPQPVKTNNNPQEGESDVWRWWSQCPHVPYPSSLYVTVEPVSPPEGNQPSIRSMGPMQPEQGSSVIANNQSSLDLQSKNGSTAHGSPPRVVLWTRLPGQTCKIPDQNLYEFSMVVKGAWCLRFSTDGKLLAVASPAPPRGSSVRVYSVENGSLEVELQGHKGPIYALDWHRDRRLLSASGDGTVRVWSTKIPRDEEACLLHPTYVYSARFHPNSSDTIASAGYDQVVRIWQKSGSKHYIILHELVNHKAYVNCLAFDIDGHVLFSGDQDGAIRVWETSTPDDNDNWYLKKSLDFKELKGNAVLSLSIHPGGRRLLVHCRSLSHPVIMVDLKLHTIMQTFIGSQSFKGHVSSCITPCGTYVISSSQDGAVYVWNADNGNQVG
jgi:jouberin